MEDLTLILTPWTLSPTTRLKVSHPLLICSVLKKLVKLPSCVSMRSNSIPGQDLTSLVALKRIFKTALLT